MAKIVKRKTASKRADKKGGGRKSPRHKSPRRGAKRASVRVPRTIETVLAAFAHDIRTPLTGILALTEGLATSGWDERERHWVAAIKDAAGHLAELTTRVVDTARSGAGHLTMRRETFDLGDFIEALAATIAARTEAKKLAYTIDIAPGLPAYVSGDPAQLRAAMENLIANAVKFTQQGEVRLRVAAKPLPRGRFRLSFVVADSGIGMSAAEIRRLFRPFAQASRAIAAQFGGSGLGLVQVRRLARAMGGDLKVESVSGHGSTFHLTVVIDPAQPGEATARELAARDRARLAGQGLHILCVEDNPYGRVVMNAILTELGHQVDFAGTGEAAIEAVSRGHYDAVLMDITLVGMDGYDTTRRIRALGGAVASVAIIGISGRAEQADVDAALAAGMNAYLTKPISPRDLVDALRSFGPDLATRNGDAGS
jgi:CheY-like chemotaxis protein/nitrogen-specific signal transduction histidine kinase